MVAISEGKPKANNDFEESALRMKGLVLGLVIALALAVGVLFGGGAAFADSGNHGCRDFGQIMPPVTPGPETGTFVSERAKNGVWNETVKGLKDANCT